MYELLDMIMYTDNSFVIVILKWQNLLVVPNISTEYKELKQVSLSLELTHETEFPFVNPCHKGLLDTD